MSESVTIELQPWDHADGVRLRALEQQARAAGVVRLLLETGTAQPDAMRFYQREGYAQIDNFGPYVGEELSVCFAVDL